MPRRSTHRGRILAVWLAAGAVAATAGSCGGDSEGNGGGSGGASVDGAADGAAGAAGATPDATTMSCESDKDCSAAGLLCDTVAGQCVECLRPTDCESDQRCESSRCVDITSCVNSLDCVDETVLTVCDPAIGECVECVTENDCPPDNDCTARRCVPFTPCDNSLDCPSQEVCDVSAGRCVECVIDADCDDDEKCGLNECRPACDSDNDCTGLGLLCDKDSGYCVQCVRHGDCPDTHHCASGDCAPDVCGPGQSSCVGNGIAQCSDAGDGFESPVPCGPQQTCTASAGSTTCDAWVCNAGLTYCEGDTLIDCAADGLSMMSEDCAASGLHCFVDGCKDQLCVPNMSFCDGGDVKLCDSTGNNATITTTCTSGEYCDPATAACTPQLCVPSQPACNGSVATTCNGDGSGFQSGGTDCALQSKACSAGVCVDECAVRDIVIVVDQSGSMTNDMVWAIAAIQSFSAAIVASNLDWRVVLIAEKTGMSGNTFCVDPPLGTGSCPADDSPPDFLHIDRRPGSDTLNELLTSFPTYEPVLRPGAEKHFFLISDDDSNLTAAQFDSSIKALSPMFSSYTFHAVYAFSSPLIPGGPCQLKAAGEGINYRQLVSDTTGSEGDICVGDYTPVITALTSCP